MEENNVAIINEMIERITKLRETRGIKMRGGKSYTMVQDRVETLRRMTGDFYQLTTEMLHYTNEPGGSIVFRAVIRNANGQTVATGHAEEIRGSSQITDTSAIEVCETSACGRALAMLGIHGGEFASAEELAIVVDKLDKKASRPAPQVVAPPKEVKAPAKPITTAPTASALVHRAAVLDEVSNRHGEATSSQHQQAVKDLSAQLDLEQAVEDAGGKPNGLHNAQIMKDLREDVAGMVSTIKGRTPILKPSEDCNMIAECFFTFMPLCDTVEETYSFWYANEGVLNTLKANDKPLFDQVKLRFVARRDEFKHEASNAKSVPA
jgi:hypothetical protein